jgi:membrane-bound lytic murein transglycosylase D
MARNSLRNRDAIYEGQRLLLGGSPAAATSVGRDEEASELIAEEPGASAVETRKGTEPVSREEAAADSPMLAAGGPTAMNADPTDYAVDARGTIVVQAAETLGHYAEWLGVSAASLRALNRMRSSQALRVGRRLALDLSRVTAKQFEQRRVNYHRGLQESFFSTFRIAGTDRYRVRPGESAWLVTQKHSNLPVWLLRQYNPELDLGNVRPGTELIIPRVVPIAGAGD